MKVSLVIPAFNEESILPVTLQSLESCPWADEVIVVNDGSSDRTADISRQYNVKLINLNKNYGKAYALKQGWQESENEIIMCLDADLGQSILEAEKLLTPLNNSIEVDCVIGRLPTPKKAGFGVMKRRAQKVIYKKTGQWLMAPLSGQRAFRRKWLSHLLDKNYVGYGIEAAMTIDLIHAGASIVEIDTNISHRETGKDLKGFIHRGRQWLEMEKTLRRNGV